MSACVEVKTPAATAAAADATSNVAKRFHRDTRYLRWKMMDGGQCDSMRCFAFALALRIHPPTPLR